MFTRRNVMRTGAAFAGAAFVLPSLLAPVRAAAVPEGLAKALATAETTLKARVGMAVLDAKGTPLWLHHADDLFPLNSTFKAFAAAAVLARIDAGSDKPDRVVRFAKGDLVTYSPVTETRLETGMTLSEICAAALAMSDNTAGNLMLDAIDGPAGLTAFLRKSGDTVSRLDRRETDLNEATPGDPRDTTTPAAAAATLHRLLFGSVLSDKSRKQLLAWMEGNKVGGPLFRSALPEGWRIADRTGAGGHGSRSIIAALMPPGRDPVVAGLYLTGTEATMDERNAAVAAVGAALVSALSS